MMDDVELDRTIWCYHADGAGGGTQLPEVRVTAPRERPPK